MVAEGTQQQYANWYYQQQQQQQQQQQYFTENSCAAAAAAAAEPSPMQLWPSYGQPTYLQYQPHHAAVYQQQQMQLTAGAQNQQQQPIGWVGEEAKNHDNNGVFNSEPSSAGTSSGSEIGSPGTPASPMEQTRPISARSPFEWMKKNNYEPSPGKTRTKDKYRVVYTEHQRLELEKEFYSSKYITTVRKAELAAAVSLSERQIKIWFQNRRAKERRKSEKRGDLQQRDIKPIIDSNGVAHPPPTSGPPPLIGMANLSLGSSLGHTSMSSLTNDLPPLSSYPSALMGYHHHPRLSAPVTPTTHHPQPPAIGTWANNSVAM